jgi:dienelactone hydrolase
MAAVAYLRASDKVSSDDISVIGWSQGGLVASAIAGRSSNLDAVALWQAVGDADATYSSLLSAETLNEGKAAAPDQTITATLPWGADVSLNGAFFDGIETFDPMAEIAAYSGPLFVSQGLADTTVLPAIPAAFIAAHDGPEQLWTAEMDHTFNVFTETEMLDSLIGATVGFFETNED